MKRQGRIGKTKLWRSDGRGRNHKFGPRIWDIQEGLKLCFCPICKPMSDLKIQERKIQNATDSSAE